MEKLQITGNADGSVVIDTKINTAGFGTGMSSLKSQFNGLGKAAGKLGGIIAAAFSIKAIVSFGKEAIELGSDLQEVQNVVDVTFTTMNEQINEFAKNAAMTAGLSETMAKRFAGTFGAMAKSFKFSEEEAFNMAISLTQLSGDVASFYNLTQDAAYTKLKSVFTGETESLKDLGVVMTQTALDDFALRKGLGKTTDQMSEQEKVALRYQFVLEQLGAASGDFVRTQDSWANQTRILNLQFDQLKATLGQGLINVLTPVLKIVNDLIARFQVLADKFLEFTNTVFGSAGDASSGIKETEKSMESLGGEIEETGRKAKKFLAPFDEIAKVSGGETIGAPSDLPLSGGTTEIGGNVKDNVSPVLDQIGEKIKKFLAPIQNIDFSNLFSSVGKLGESFKNLGTKISENFGWIWTDILVPLGEWVIEEAVPWSVDLFSESLDGLSGSFDNLSSILKTVWEYVEPLFAELKDSGKISLYYLREEIRLTTERLEYLTGIIDSLLKGDWERAEDNFTKYLESLQKSMNNFADWWNEMMKKDWFSSLIDILKKGIEGIIYSGSGGSSFSFTPSAYSVSPSETYQIPHLATGAVIPPRSPFMAVLGDQRHGTNIEAPLSTIQEAVAEVMDGYLSANMAGHEATVAVLREILEAVLGIQIGDDVIAQAAERYNRKMNIARGGAL